MSFSLIILHFFTENFASKFNYIFNTRPIYGSDSQILSLKAKDLEFF
jgi:hypothetical protein